MTGSAHLRPFREGTVLRNWAVFLAAARRSASRQSVRSGSEDAQVVLPAEGGAPAGPVPQPRRAESGEQLPGWAVPGGFSLPMAPAVVRKQESELRVLRAPGPAGHASPLSPSHSPGTCSGQRESLWACGGGGRPEGGGRQLLAPVSQPPHPAWQGHREETEGLWQGRWQGPPQPSRPSFFGTNFPGLCSPLPGPRLFLHLQKQTMSCPASPWEQPSPGLASASEPGPEPHTLLRGRPDRRHNRKRGSGSPHQREPKEPQP